MQEMKTKFQVFLTILTCPFVCCLLIIEFFFFAVFINYRSLEVINASYKQAQILVMYTPITNKSETQKHHNFVG